MKHNLLRGIALIAFALLMVASTEVSARMLSPRPTENDFLRQHAPVIDNMIAIAPLRIDDKLPDYSSPLLNVRNGERVTAGQPLVATHDIYMFGSSTLFGFLNSDEETLSSQLQRLIPDARIHNMGLVADNATLMLAHLKHTKLHPGDSVIFYTGSMELINAARELDGQHYDFCRSALSMANDIHLLHWLCDNRITPVPLDDQTRDDIVSHYDSAITRARQYTEQAGAAFYNFLEPTQAMGARQTFFSSTYDVDTATAYSLYPMLYPLLRQTGAIDLSRRLDNVPGAYIDDWHTTGSANALIAQSIKQHLILPI